MPKHFIDHVRNLPGLGPVSITAKLEFKNMISIHFKSMLDNKTETLNI